MTVISKLKPKATAFGTFDVDSVRADFPILSEKVYEKPLVYLDSAASAQKPRSVIDKISRTYETEYANVHRGVHNLSQRATDAMEAARETVRAFINAKVVQEIIFVRGATEGINLVAFSWGQKNLSKGDEIVLSEMEHHSNIVPWQLVAEQTGSVIKVIPIEDDGTIDMNAFVDLISDKTRIVAVTHVSNSLGTLAPIEKIIKIAHKKNIPVLIDGCQAAPHLALNMQSIDADFYVFSGHKIYGPSGIGVLYGKKELLNSMPPYQGGGEMIDTVTFQKTTYAELPFKFEAGTPNISGAIGMGAAVEYINNLGIENIGIHEQKLLEYATKELSKIEGIKFFGTAPDKASILSFLLGDIHPHDIGTILDREGIAVRTGHHCAQTVMDRFNIAATVRASIGMYNTREDIDVLVSGLSRVKEMFVR